MNNQISNIPTIVIDNESKTEPNFSTTSTLLASNNNPNNPNVPNSSQALLDDRDVLTLTDNSVW
jgi:hypothetical protein